MTTPTRRAELERFDQGWITTLESWAPMRLVFALIGLTRVGEHAASLDALAVIIDRPVTQTVALLRENTTARIDGGLVYWDVPFPVDRARRTLHIGDRTIPMNRCAPALFVYAVLLDVPFHVEETCPATGAPIRIDFVPGGYERVDPPQRVTAMMSPDDMCAMDSMTFDQADEICLHAPLFASAEAAGGWLASHPGGRMFTVTEMFQRPIVAHYRDNLRPLIHPASH